MNASEYQQCAERTMIDPNSKHRMVNAALGLCGEAAEIDQTIDWGGDDLLTESGDLLWYVAQMCRALDVSIADIPPERKDFAAWTVQQSISVLYRNTGALADMVKKRVFHRNTLPTKPKMIGCLQAVVGAVDHILSRHGFTIEEAFDANNQKLLKRHPNGFSPETANARADEAMP